MLLNLRRKACFIQSTRTSLPRMRKTSGSRSCRWSAQTGSTCTRCCHTQPLGTQTRTQTQMNTQNAHTHIYTHTHTHTRLIQYIPRSQLNCARFLMHTMKIRTTLPKRSRMSAEAMRTSGSRWVQRELRHSTAVMMLHGATSLAC